MASDRIGQKFGRLTVIAKSSQKLYGNEAWDCICECGNSKLVRWSPLRSGQVKTCGKCLSKGQKPYEDENDEIGKLYGSLTVIALDGINDRGNKMLKCECECGNIVSVLKSNLRAGSTESCGCYRSNRGTFLASKGLVTIGKRETTEDEFKHKLMVIHGDIFGFDRMKYSSGNPKLELLCKECGVYFTILKGSVLQGHGCTPCSKKRMSAKLTRSFQSFKEEATKVHNFKFEYIEASYINMSNKMIAICPTHGEFKIWPGGHLLGVGCASCAHRGFSQHSPAILYYLKVHDGGRTLYKIGITNKTVKTRFQLLDDQELITTLATRKYENGSDAYAKEQEILHDPDFKQFKYRGPDVLSSGNTELFTRDIFDLDK